MKSLVQVARSRTALQAGLGTWRRGGRALGFVPTMGALHAGHLSLVERAARECGGRAVVSIFVNPTQFGPGEDYRRYPRVLSRDLSLLSGLGRPLLVFAPDVGTVYPPGFCTSVEVEGPLTRVLEGEFRPHHFKGVASVVARLFGLVRPDKAFFGLKDYQQFRVVSRMAQDLALPVEVVGCPTVREQDGLAMSSRNQYLSDAERVKATALIQALRAAAGLFKKGAALARVEAAGRDLLARRGGFRLDYFRAVDPESLQVPARGAWQVLLAVAARLGNTRLIDNLLARRAH